MEDTDNADPDKNRVLHKVENMTELISSSGILTANDVNKEAENSIINNEVAQQRFTHNTEIEKYNNFMSKFLSGNWENFFDIWNTLFPIHIKKSLEYKTLTIRLRVHFATLPIRIIQYHQSLNNELIKSEKVIQILSHFSNKINLINEKTSEDDITKITVDSMKQLEYFLSSYEGQRLATELKNSVFTKLFTLPYIINPQKDESVKEIFHLSWLEELNADLDIFIKKFLKIGDSIESENLSKLEFFSPTNFYNSTNSYKSKLTENNSELMCDRIIHSAIKNKEIEDWIAHHQRIIHNLCTKSTQTRISSIKTGTGFSLISEPHNMASIVTPNVNFMPNKQSISYNDELNTTKSRLFSVYQHYKKLKFRFHKLHDDYQKINEIAEKLTIALEDSVRGQPVNVDIILQSCMKIFPDRFNRHIQTDSEDTSIEFREDLSKNHFSIERKPIVASSTIVPPKLLNYRKIKSDLKNGSIRTKLLLLQALRQKLTLNHPEHRYETIQEYSRNDLLGLNEKVPNTDETNLLPYLLQPFNLHIAINFIQQTTARFLNTVASLSYGRLYLTSGPIVLNSIIKYLDSYNNEASDGVTLDMLLAALQKMSLRRQQRYYMIEANLVEWLIYHLSNENFRMGPYRLEYSCALLMNLSLQSAAWSRASTIAPLFASTMTSLLSTDCTSILPYVNGILQNFLLNNEINEEAKKLHLAEILEYHCVKSNKELRNHFSHTLQIHKRESDEYLSDCDEFPDEDDEILDFLEKELDENDPIKNEEGGLWGENLLAIRYAVPAFFSSSTNHNKLEAKDVPNKQTNNSSLRSE